MERHYEWKMASFAKGIKPEDAENELERIEAIYGDLTPENVLKASKPKKALFNCLFTWDDSQAAIQYRLQQARRILNNIEVHIISNGENKVIPVYEVIKIDAGRVYKHFESFTPDDLEQVKLRTIREINYLKLKLSTYDRFNIVIQKLGEAVELTALV